MEATQNVAVETTVEAYPDKFARAKRLAAKLLKDNEISMKTKLAHKLVYALWYGVFNGDLPAGVSILFLSGRLEMLVEADHA